MILNDHSHWGSFRTNSSAEAELRAVVEAMKLLPDGASACIVLDCKVVHQGLTETIKTWRVNGWRKSNGKLIAHADLWQEASTHLLRLGEITFQWVTSHASNPGNHRADELARRARNENGSRRK